MMQLDESELVVDVQSACFDFHLEKRIALLNQFLGHGDFRAANVVPFEVGVGEAEVRAGGDQLFPVLKRLRKSAELAEIGGLSHGTGDLALILHGFAPS